MSFSEVRLIWFWRLIREGQTIDCTLNSRRKDNSNMLYEIVNGGLLQHSQGKKVSIKGTVKNVNSNGMSFDITTTDNITVTIILTSALDDMLEGIVEVIGTVISSNSVKAEEYIRFAPEQTEDFDVEGYNKLCAFYQQIPDIYSTHKED